MTDSRQGDSSFLSRWSRRKAAVREGKPVPDEPAAPPSRSPDAAVAGPTPSPAAGAAASPAPATTPAAPAPPTLADVAALKPGDAIARFVARGVDESVKRAALKTLFADPHFNVMDGLDIYIDDYTKPDPIPPDVLRRLTQSESLRLFEPLEEEVAALDSAAGPAQPSLDAPADPGQEGGRQAEAEPAHVESSPGDATQQGAEASADSARPDHVREPDADGAEMPPAAADDAGPASAPAARELAAGGRDNPA